MQVLKEEVKNKILLAAEEIFYKKDYRSAKLTEIAELADVPVALIYTYFKNKATLFDEIVEPVYINLNSGMAEEEKAKGCASEKFEDVGKEYINNLLSEHKRLVILMDKSAGTKHMDAKDEFIAHLQKHIQKGLKSYSKKKYDPMLAHILAGTFTESLLEIARHYENEKKAKSLFDLLMQCYYKGVDSL